MARANESAKGAAQLAHAALRGVLKRLDKMGREGVVVDEKQLALLTRWADQAQRLAVQSGEDTPDLFTQDAAPKARGGKS